MISGDFDVDICIYIYIYIYIHIYLAVFDQEICDLGNFNLLFLPASMRRLRFLYPLRRFVISAGFNVDIFDFGWLRCRDLRLLLDLDVEICDFASFRCGYLRFGQVSIYRDL